jgi:hypothetical protein
MLSRLPLWSLTLLAFSLPFELDEPLWRVGPLAVTNVELLLAVTLLLTAVPIIQTRQIRWPDRYWLWLLPFGLALLLAAAVAPAYRGNALKAGLRLMSGILLALATLQIVRHPRDAYWVAIALLVGGLTAVFIGMGESVRNQPFDWLTPLRNQITVAGEYLRLTGTFDYANQAAMFIEATVPFLLALAWAMRRGAEERRSGGAGEMLLLPSAPLLLLFLLTLLYLQATILTFSRGSFVTIILVSLLLAVWLVLGRMGIAETGKKRMALWWFLLAVVTAVLAAASLIYSSGFRLRLQSGNEEQWYLAHLEAPPVLETAANRANKVPVTVTNAGKLVWRSEDTPPILLGARWINTETEQEHGQPRWPFVEPVRPGETVEMLVSIKAPAEPGTYTLYWDVVQENVTWFGSKTRSYAETAVTVTPGSDEPQVIEETTGPGWGYNLPIPNRRTLWLLAWQMFQERPLLGIGFDNFRLTYGPRLDATALANTTIHTNNWYLEMLVSLGLVGAVPFLIWLLWLGLDLLRQTWRADITMWQVAIAAGLLAFLIHGFLDFFLLFNATGLLFWLLAGLWASGKRYDL